MVRQESMADPSAQTKDFIWSNPLQARYHNIESSYEDVVRSVECLVENFQVYKSMTSILDYSCLDKQLDKLSSYSKEDADHNSFTRSILEGPAKEGPFTTIRIVRVGQNKCLLQIKSNKWHIFLGTSDVEELEELRLKEIRKLLLKLKDKRNT